MFETAFDIGIAYEAAMQIFNLIWGIGDGMLVAFIIVFISLGVTAAIFIKVADG